jgi:hypothetical protein
LWRPPADLTCSKASHHFQEVQKGGWWLEKLGKYKDCVPPFQEPLYSSQSHHILSASLCHEVYRVAHWDILIKGAELAHGAQPATIYLNTKNTWGIFYTNVHWLFTKKMKSQIWAKVEHSMFHNLYINTHWDNLAGILAHEMP